MNSLLLVLLAIGVPLALNLVFTPIVIRIAGHFGWFDRLHARKIHTGNVSRLGGIGFFLAFFIGLSIVVLSLPTEVGFRLRFLIPGFGMLLVFGIGIIDDFYELKAALKFAVQILAVTMVVGSGFMFNDIRIPAFGISIKLWLFAYPITFLWILGIINAINLIDGMDGLAGGLSMLIAASYGVIMFLTGSIMIGMVAFALAGSLLGFLVFNKPKARIFMGDGGAYYLGYMLAILPIITNNRFMDELLKIPSLENSWHGSTSLLHAGTLLTIPIADTLAAMIRRARKGQRFSEPDRHHMHHKMLAMGMNTWSILAILGTLQLILGLAVIYDVIVANIISGILIYVSWLLVTAFFIWLDRAQYKNKVNGTVN